MDKSLLRCEADPDGETRFHMLETIREYARERLDELSESVGARRRHAAHFQGVAERSERPLMGSEQVATLARLKCELDNLRTALAWSIESDEAALGLRVAGAIWRFWQIRGHLGEGRASLDRLIALPSAAPRDAARAKGLAALGGVAYWQGDFASIRSVYEESLAIYREIGDRPATAEATYNLGFMPFVQGDMTEAQRLFEESGALYQALGDDIGFARTTEARAAVAFRLGDYATARALEGRNVERFRELGLRSQYADSLMLHGLITHREGDDKRAQADLGEAATIQGAAGDSGSVVGSVMVLAIFAAENGDAERAARLVGAAAAHRERHDVGATAVEILGLEGPESLVRRALGDERARALMAEGRALTLDQALALGLRQEASAPS